MYVRRNETNDYSTRRYTKVNIIRVIEERAARLSVRKNTILLQIRLEKSRTR